MPSERKRKRKRSRHDASGDQKRQRTTGESNAKHPVVRHALLERYYPAVLTLREYLISRLPTGSKIRRKKILSVGRRENEDNELGGFLDQTLIGVSTNSDLSQGERWRQWTTFSQKADDSISFVNSNAAAIFSQSEIVDFAIWLLFSKTATSTGRNQHLLCQGFRKDGGTRPIDQGDSAGIPGVTSTYPNFHVTSMKAFPWPQLLALLGKAGERTMIDLILDCGIFLPIKSGKGTFHQLSGHPLADLPVFQPTTAANPTSKSARKQPRQPSNINFVRNRMLYARAALNAQGRVRFGLRHIHVLNRYPLRSSPPLTSDSLSANTIQVMMYIFPRQFGLHNVFTDDVDSRQTAQPFKDYTLREDEIHAKFPTSKSPKIPKRLQGEASRLVHRLQVCHSRLSYNEILDYYCPVTSSSETPSFLLASSHADTQQTSTFKTQVPLPAINTNASTSKTAVMPPRKPIMMDHATPSAMVSAFCRAVLVRLIPSKLWGTGDAQQHNERTFLRNVDHFIELRRFESMSLHEVSQKLKISAIDWLAPPGVSGQKTSQSDIAKRWEIFHEFLYYLFDSILIPLIRSNFHVSESNVHRYRLFYFRHDVWRSLAEPALASLKITMFEEVRLEKAQRILDSRTLGFSQVRLLPKENGVRPIMNLRRRCLKKGYKNVLGSSINSLLAPVYNVLSCERKLNPDRLGASMFSVGDLYARLKTFKAGISDSYMPLYFAKVDVQAAFDNIPQDAILVLIASLTTESEYRISKHAEIKPGDNYRADGAAKPIRKWPVIAHAPDDFQSFEEELHNNIAVGRKNTVFIETVVNQFRDKKEILSLLAEHIQNNLVKIGNKFYRQKEGIPQGSVLSSLLCNYFYADLETSHLSFLQSGESLLLRLIDDFLLITTNGHHAKQFLQVMHDGVPAYGVRVNPEKTLVNFEATINENKVKRVVGRDAFPFCGSFVDMGTLNISKDRERKKHSAIADSLTVEFSKVPGKTFQRKVLNTFKIQSHAMYLDTSFNSLPTVLNNTHSAFLETATKMYTYISCLPSKKQPGTKLIIKTIQDLIELAFVLMKSKGGNRMNQGYRCCLNKVQVEWLAVNSMRDVLGKKQSRYRGVIGWCGVRIKLLEMREAKAIGRMILGGKWQTGR